MDFKKLSRYNQQVAWQIIETTHIIDIWKNTGAEINLVGSLKSGLLMKNRDIDFHIYTDQLILSESFAAMAQLAEQPEIKDIQYKNLIDTEEACIEWHAWYEDKEKNRWQIDLIHILKGSRYDGVVERVTDSIIKHLTPETREAILRIKYDTPDTEKIPGIEIYRAVLSGGVRSYSEFRSWHPANPMSNTLEWLPE